MLVAALSATACGQPPEDQPTPLAGPELVAGTSLDRYGVLVIPRRGGTAEFRAIGSPSTVRWTGRLELDPASAAHSLGSAALLRSGGQLGLYTTSPVEALSALPDVGPGARWIASALGGAFVDGPRILAITPGAATEIVADGEALWAAPADQGRVVALIEGEEGRQLAVWEPGQEAPERTRPVATAGPLVLAGWGRQLIGASADGLRLQSWSIPALEPGRELALEGRVRALAVSPSQHRVHVASADPSRLTAIDRYEWRESESSRVETPLRALRPGIVGDRLVAFDGTAAWSVRAGEGDSRPVPGEWRPDLPLALPGTGILLSVGGEMAVLREPAGELEAVDGPSEAWWLPFRWGARRPVATVAATDDELADEMGAGGDELEGIPGGVAFSFDRIGLLTMGTPPDRAFGDAQPREAQPPAEPLELGPSGVPIGFFAVAASLRELGGLRRTRQLLDASGYRTHVLNDVEILEDEEGGQTEDRWYRLLVGPYPSRAEAQAAARSLREERGIEAWIYREAAEELEPEPIR